VLPVSDDVAGRQARVDALRRAFAPRSVVIVGARDSSATSAGVIEGLERTGFTGEIALVNRSGAAAHGREAHRSCAEIGRRMDAAVVLTPASAVPAVLDDLAGAHVGTAVVLSGGWAETGADGRAAQDAVADRARRLGITLIGPNCLGFMNFAARTGAWVANVPPDWRDGSVAIVSQSGGIGNALVDLAAEWGVGLSHVVTTGNEAAVSTTDVLEYLAEDESTSAVAVFCEAIRHPERFALAAARAVERGKAIVMLKAGSSPAAARNAVTHTGSLVGNDAVVTAALRRLGVVRVSSLEELVATAALLGGIRPLRAPGVAVVSISGGSVDIVADEAERAALRLPAYDETAVASLREILPPFASVQNPLDITGGAIGDEFAKVLGVIDKQADIGLIVVLCNVPASPSCKDPSLDRLLGTVAAGLQTADTPGVIVAQTIGHAQRHGQRAVARAGIRHLLPGLALGVNVVKLAVDWSSRVAALDRCGPWAPGVDAGGHQRVLAFASPHDAGPLSEWTARRLLVAAGVPFVPAELARSEAEAIDAARRFGGAVAVKLVSPDVMHKTDVGAVRLDVQGDDDVQAAYRAVVAAAGPGGRVEGAIVAPMRSGGVELLVGVTTDDAWGPVLAVGLGGVLVEALRDVVHRVLPVDRVEVAEMLDELTGAPLLAGGRGRPAVDRVALIDAIVAIADTARQLGSRLDSLEVNPLRVGHAGAEALDAVVVLRSEGR
jgi:acetate---CoA ligase (ADP-forming)